MKQWQPNQNKKLGKIIEIVNLQTDDQFESNHITIVNIKNPKIKQFLEQNPDSTLSCKET